MVCCCSRMMPMFAEAALVSRSASRLKAGQLDKPEASLIQAFLAAAVLLLTMVYAEYFAAVLDSLLVILSDSATLVQENELGP